MPTQSEHGSPSRRPLALVLLAALCAAVAGLVYVVTREPAGAQVTIDSVPQGASVRLDGAALDCVTPCLLPRPAPGDHVITVSRPGFQDFSANVAIPAQGKLTVPFTLVKREPVAPAPDAAVVVQPPAPKLVTVRLVSLPPGATVVLDKDVRGTTPLDLELEEGARLPLRLELDGFQTLAETLTADGQPHEYQLKPKGGVAVRPPKRPEHDKPPEVKPATGTVRFAVSPWATVECPPYKFGDTPFKDREIPAGDYRCTFTNPDHPPQVRTVKVEAGGLTTVKVSFE